MRGFPTWPLAAAVLALAQAPPEHAPPAGVAPPPPAVVDLGADLETARAASGAPALVAVVTDKTAVIAAGAAGVRWLGGGPRVGVDDAFHIGSVTKPMTATMIAGLVDEGLLEWDSTIGDVLPEVAAGILAVYRPVTLAQLLSHEAGVRPIEEEAELATLPEATGTPREQRLAFVAWVLAQEPVMPPGSAFRYSNAGFTVAAAMAEKVTGRGWEELIRERLFDPLGMTTAGLGWPTDDDPEAPRGHVPGPDGALAPLPLDDPYRLGPFAEPSGDVHVSMPDLARFARLHLQGYDGEATLLEPETFRLMHTARLQSGLGWGVQELLGHDPVSVFAGSADTFVTYIALVHDADVAVVVSANAADEASDAAAKQVFKDLIVRFAGDDRPPPTP